MRTLGLWIAGIFGLGLAVGSLVAARSDGSVENEPSALRLVDCGAGREARVEQVVENGEIVSRVTCAAAEPTPMVHPTPAPVVTTEPVQPVREARPQTSGTAEAEHSSRSLKDSALIIGGAAGAGAGIGAIAKGKKGAAVGAAAGAVAGTVYDLATRNKNKN